MIHQSLLRHGPSCFTFIYWACVWGGCVLTVWRSGDSLEELIFSYHVGSGGLTQMSLLLSHHHKNILKFEVLSLFLSFFPLPSLPSLYHSYFWRCCLSLTLRQIWVGWLVTEHQASDTVSVFSVLATMPRFYVCSRNPNSGSHTFTVGPLPTEWATTPPPASRSSLLLWF